MALPKILLNFGELFHCKQESQAKYSSSGIFGEGGGGGNVLLKLFTTRHVVYFSKYVLHDNNVNV